MTKEEITEIERRSHLIITHLSHIREKVSRELGYYRKVNHADQAEPLQGSIAKCELIESLIYQIFDAAKLYER